MLVVNSIYSSVTLLPYIFLTAAVTLYIGEKFSSIKVCLKNLNILKGATIAISHGKKEGALQIGNNVYVGLNAIIMETYGKCCSYCTEQLC